MLFFNSILIFFLFDSQWKIVMRHIRTYLKLKKKQMWKDERRWTSASLREAYAQAGGTRYLMQFRQALQVGEENRGTVGARYGSHWSCQTLTCRLLVLLLCVASRKQSEKIVGCSQASDPCTWCSRTLESPHTTTGPRSRVASSGKRICDLRNNRNRGDKRKFDTS